MCEVLPADKGLAKVIGCSGSFLSASSLEVDISDVVSRVRHIFLASSAEGSEVEVFDIVLDDGCISGCSRTLGASGLSEVDISDIILGTRDIPLASKTGYSSGVEAFDIARTSGCSRTLGASGLSGVDGISDVIVGISSTAGDLFEVDSSDVVKCMPVWTPIKGIRHLASKSKVDLSEVDVVLGVSEASGVSAALLEVEISGATLMQSVSSTLVNFSTERNFFSLSVDAFEICSFLEGSSFDSHVIDFSFNSRFAVVCSLLLIFMNTE